MITRRCQYRYIEKLPTIAILQIPSEYRKIFKGSKSTELREKSPVLDLKRSSFL